MCCAASGCRCRGPAVAATVDECLRKGRGGGVPCGPRCNGLCQRQPPALECCRGSPLEKPSPPPPTLVAGHDHPPFLPIWEGSPTTGMGVARWTHLANGEGGCPCPCGHDTALWNRDSSGALVGTTNQGKGRVSREVRIGQTGRVRAVGGEMPMGTATYRGQWFKERKRRSGERPIGAASFRQQSTAGVMPNPLPPGVGHEALT